MLYESLTDPPTKTTQITWLSLSHSHTNFIFTYSTVLDYSWERNKYYTDSLLPQTTITNIIPSSVTADDFNLYITNIAAADGKRSNVIIYINIRPTQYCNDTQCKLFAQDTLYNVFGKSVDDVNSYLQMCIYSVSQLNTNT